MYYKYIIILMIAALSLSCSGNVKAGRPGVIAWISVNDTTGYWRVDLDIEDAGSRFELGVSYGKAILRKQKNYAKIIDACLSRLPLDRMLGNMANVRPQVPQEYQDEIEGLASVLCKTRASAKGDGKLSLEELYAFELITDTWRAAACSGLGVWGTRSADGKTRVIRLLDYDSWPMAGANGLAAVTTIKGQGKTVYLIGYLGMIGAITAFNQDGVFAGILDSATGAPYDSRGVSSYCMDLRYALESYGSMDAVGRYMIDHVRKYSYNHNVLLADSSGCAVVENNVSGDGEPERLIRTELSELRQGVSWPFPDSMCVVNSFVAAGQSDNHTRKVNSMRWGSYAAEMEKYGVLGEREIKLISGYYSGVAPGDPEEGDLYCRMPGFSNQQTVYFEPSAMKLSVAFIATDGIIPKSPIFADVPIAFGSK